jgi:hypothetical protein
MLSTWKSVSEEEDTIKKQYKMHYHTRKRIELFFDCFSIFKIVKIRRRSHLITTITRKENIAASINNGRYKTII